MYTDIHLSDIDLLNLISNQDHKEFDPYKEMDAIDHLADCDACRSIFSDWLFAVMPQPTNYRDQ
jgi:hypothetical protein